MTAGDHPRRPFSGRTGSAERPGRTNRERTRGHERRGFGSCGCWTVLAIVLLIVAGCNVIARLQPKPSIFCGAPCEGSPSAAKSTVRYGDGLAVTVSAARPTQKRSIVALTVTLDNRGDVPAAHGRLRVWSVDPDKGMSLPGDGQDGRVESEIAPKGTVDVDYWVHIEKVAEDGRITVFVKPGDRYATARWNVPLPDQAPA